MSSFSIPSTSDNEEFSVENGIQNIQLLTSALIAVINNLKIFFMNDDDEVDEIFSQADETNEENLVERLDREAARNYKDSRSLSEDFEDRRSQIAEESIRNKKPELN